MITPRAQDAKHKAWMFRLLGAIFDDVYLSSVLYFKGGTCAAMREFLDRFSVDLDFDYLGDAKDIVKTQKEMEKIFGKLDLEIKDKSQNVPQYFLKYDAPSGERNTLKIDISFPPPKTNQYESVRIVEIDRIVNCQTIETMFANKLVALIERYERNGSIAGRDLYDTHYFFMQGFQYDEKVIQERRQQKPADFINGLIEFIKKEITQTIIDQDINTLVDPKKFQQIRKTLKQETLIFLQDELIRLTK
ncbi:MAG: nucleotidyl transferase AbiEii/AbiGii toxin family protein [Parcubacteria group bacterium]|jgi:predicted nucleotidyltransferase component of viral defense system